MMNDKTTPRYIYIMQILSISLIWFFVTAITVWIIWLIVLSIQLNDAPDISFAISLVVIPIFFALAGVLTYVFVGLQRNREPTAQGLNEMRTALDLLENPGKEDETGKSEKE